VVFVVSMIPAWPMALWCDARRLDDQILSGAFYAEYAQRNRPMGALGSQGQSPAAVLAALRRVHVDPAIAGRHL